MEYTINIGTDDIKKDVFRHLSIIGKRLKAKDGSSMFSSTTLSSAEDGEFDQHLSGSVARIAAEFPEYITEYAGSKVIITLWKERWNESMRAAFVDSFMSALTACVTYEIISIYAPDYAKKFADDTNASIQDLRRHFYTNRPPDIGGDTLKSCTGTVTLD